MIMLLLIWTQCSFDCIIYVCESGCVMSVFFGYSHPECSSVILVKEATVTSMGWEVNCS
jgi:hypothetical protein